MEHRTIWLLDGSQLFSCGSTFKELSKMEVGDLCLPYSSVWTARVPPNSIRYISFCSFNNPMSLELSISHDTINLFVEISLQ